MPTTIPPSNEKHAAPVRNFATGAFFLAVIRRVLATEVAIMPDHHFILPVFATVSLLIGSPGCAISQNNPSMDVARLRQALMGNWVIDAEATADSMARSGFGPQQSVTLSKTGDKPATMHTNFTNKPFNQQEYEKTKRISLESLRAPEAQVRVTFAPDSTGVELPLTGSANQSVGFPFRWTLQGHKLVVEYPDKRAGADFQTEFTNTNQLCRPIHYLGACMFFKPEASAPKPRGGPADRTRFPAAQR